MGQLDHPNARAAVEKVEKAASAAGIPIGSNALNAEMAQDLFRCGYRAIACFDVMWIREKTTTFKNWTDD